MTFRVLLTETATADIEESYEYLSGETPGYAPRWYGSSALSAPSPACRSAAR